MKQIPVYMNYRTSLSSLFISDLKRSTTALIYYCEIIIVCGG